MKIFVVYTKEIKIDRERITEIVMPLKAYKQESNAKYVVEQLKNTERFESVYYEEMELD